MSEDELLVLETDSEDEKKDDDEDMVTCLICCLPTLKEWSDFKYHSTHPDNATCFQCIARSCLRGYIRFLCDNRNITHTFPEYLDYLTGAASPLDIYNDYLGHSCFICHTKCKPHFTKEEKHKIVAFIWEDLAFFSGNTMVKYLLECISELKEDIQFKDEQTLLLAAEKKKLVHQVNNIRKSK